MFQTLKLSNEYQNMKVEGLTQPLPNSKIVQRAAYLVVLQSFKPSKSKAATKTIQAKTPLS
jgi:hypothetical protein